MKISISLAKLANASILTALPPLSFIPTLAMPGVEQPLRCVVVTGH